MARLTRIQQAGGDAAASAAVRAGAKTTPAAPPEAEKVDLDNAATQERILTPPPAAPLSAAGEAITLHELPARLQRQLAGVTGTVIAAIAGKPGPFDMRMASALAADAALSSQFFTLVARATYPADFKIDQEIVNRINADAARFDEGVKYQELGPLFDRMMSLNKIQDAFTRPKS